MHHGQDCDALRFGSIYQKERITLYENPASLGAIRLPGHGKRERARRGFFDCDTKPFCPFGLNIRVVMYFFEELSLCFLDKASAIHKSVISRAFAKTSSAGTSLASPRS